MEVQSISSYVALASVCCDSEYFVDKKKSNLYVKLIKGLKLGKCLNAYFEMKKGNSYIIWNIRVQT